MKHSAVAFSKGIVTEKPSPVKGAWRQLLRLLPVLLALVCLLWSSSARADATLNISNGSIRLRTEGGALQYQQGTGAWTAYTGTLTIAGAKDAQGGIAASANTVSVTSGAHTVKFNDLDISSSSGAPAGVSSGATLNLILKGTNTLIQNVYDLAGLAVPAGATLTISADGNGSLTAIGSNGGAGIGGGWNVSGGAVTVNGGILTVKGGSTGAGIGGGGGGAGGAVTINGGTLTVQGGDSGAGIGGGWGASGGAVTINGGMVTTQGGSGGAGIGGGNGGSSDTVTVSGGTIVATTDEYGASPGGGDGGAAGIGGGANGAGGTVIVSGGSISATGNVGGAGIGGGDQGVGLSFIVSGGTIIAKGSAGVDIGAGYNKTNQGTAVITGGSIHVSNMGPAVTNGNQTVKMKTVNFASGTTRARVILTSGVPAYYGMNDLFLDENKDVYPWVSDDYAPTGIRAAVRVTFDTQGGGAVAPVTVGAGAALGSAFPADPVLSGSSFGGWFTQVNGGGTAFTSATVVTADLTVYALWNKHEILILDPPADQYVTAGQTARFTVNARGEGLSYQWQIDRGAGSGSRNLFVPSALAEDWQDLPGAVSDTYVTSETKLSNDGYLYRCRVSDRYGDVLYSASAKLHVTAAVVVPQTGDGQQPLLWLLMVVFASGTLAALWKKKRKE